MNRKALLATVFIYFFFLTALYYLIFPRISGNSLLLYSLTSLFILLFVFYAAGIFGMFRGTVLRHAELTCFYRNYIFPVATFFVSFFTRERSKRWESFIKFNNKIIRQRNFSFAPDEIIVLLPHCLQNTSCDIRITTDLKNCRQCGRCEIGKLIKIFDEYGVRGYVVTGGTLARRIAFEKKPRGIVAVACHHDLAEGIELVYPVPAYGVLNTRPEGPCVNTHVDPEKVKKGIEALIST
ncbi:MAG: DUF116 domain-containing protein [bacterium]